MKHDMWFAPGTGTKKGPADWHFNTYGTGNGKTEIWENGVGTGTEYKHRVGNGASQGSKKITLSNQQQKHEGHYIYLSIN